MSDVKIPSGVSQARVLFAEVNAPGYQIKTEGAKSIRGDFIARAQVECGLTKNGASTYFQNLKNEAAGKPLYYPTKKKDDQPKNFVDVGSALTSAPSVNAAVEEAKRWFVVNEEGAEVAQFDSRKQAQEHAKSEDGLKWMDRTKVAA